MASPTTAELNTKTVLLEKGIEVLRQEVERYELMQLRERVKVLEEQVGQLTKKAEEVEKVRQPLAVLEAQVAELKREEEESGKRAWQFVYIAAGAGFALLSSFLVQLVFYFLKK